MTLMPFGGLLPIDGLLPDPSFVGEGGEGVLPGDAGPWLAPPGLPGTYVRWTALEGGA